ncbi:PP2C family serine/threonine-protein phosphatase [Sanguibacter sp. HDW7]|uniref:PP2C family protein-serine/threonine phosphatase n=1 Tax=Sanguibacter sp. HDW7 TaxID=2714931 RepID=UPI00140D2EFD|nr:PP2C family serine/threonine-protein phosphatase [Sanguibacter sp. HDW7]QIK84765.1 serine/threonine-protein phosphatase [Sanguibacter sp. HDW7]
MPIALRYALRSDVGLVRSNNQDSGFAGPNLLVVADGMGGHAGGDVASSIAVATFAPLNDDSFGADDAVAELERAVDEAQEALVARSTAEPELSGMGTTVTALLRAGSMLAMAHMGDSRAYLLREGELTQVTTDHTFVQHLVDTGKITPEEAEVHPQRSVVMRVLCDFGLGLRPDLSVREGRPGDRWLLCSDGLSGYVSHDTMRTTLAEIDDPGLCTERLVQLALRAGGPDNITCIVADVLDPDALPEGVEPTSSIEVAGAAAVERDVPSAAAESPAAKAAALAAAATSPEADPESEEAAAEDVEVDVEANASALPRRRRRTVARIVWSLVALLVLGGGGWGAYAWTQTQYYLGVDDGHVAIFRGIPQSVGPVSLSHVLLTTETRVEDLDPFKADRLRATIHQPSYVAARTHALSLAVEAASPTPTETPSVTPTLDPTAPVEPAPTTDGGATP